MLKKYARVAITGDSITDCGRARPFGCRNSGLGNGYAAYVEVALSARHPEQYIWVENTGISGNTSGQLAERFDTDVLARKPDVVTIMIGINNVWRHFDIGQFFPKDLERNDIAYYERDLREMIEKAQDNDIQVVLLTPYFLESNKADPMRAMCDAYAEVVRRLAAEYGAALCDVQAVMDNFLDKSTNYMLSSDRVHPNQTGHFLIAESLLKTLETLSLS